MLCHVSFEKGSFNLCERKKTGRMPHLPSPHQRPSGHRLNLAPGYPSSAAARQKERMPRITTNVLPQRKLFHTNFAEKINTLVRSVFVFSGPKRPGQIKEVPTNFGLVSAETKKLSFFLSDFLLGFGNGRLQWLMRFTGSTNFRVSNSELDPVIAGDTIHLNQKNKKTNYHPFVVRTKSIHQNKKKQKQKKR